MGTVLSIAADTIAQLAGYADGDFVMIDTEHAPMTVDVITRMLHARVASSRGAVTTCAHTLPWRRVCEVDYGLWRGQQVLEAGKVCHSVPRAYVLLTGGVFRPLITVGTPISVSGLPNVMYLLY